MFSPQSNEGVASSIIIATLMVVLKPSVAIQVLQLEKCQMFSPQNYVTYNYNSGFLCDL